MSERDGGPAFPSETKLVAKFDPQNRDAPPVMIGGAQTGMSLRDYFSAAALQGALAGDSGFNKMVERYGHDKAAAKMAEACYRVADAMLAERAKE